MSPAASGPSKSRGADTDASAAGGPKRPPRPRPTADDTDADQTAGTTPDLNGSASTQSRGKRGGGSRSRAKAASPSSAATAPKPVFQASGSDSSTLTEGRESALEPEDPGSIGRTGGVPLVDPTLVAEPGPLPVDHGADDKPKPVKAPRRDLATDDQLTSGRRRGRRVRRVVRRIDLWSVLKLAIVLYTCLYVAVLATLALLWGLAYSSGQIEKVESFMADVGMDNYRFYGDQMWRACAMIGAVGVLTATVLTVLTAALVNVISEMTGGIRLVVIEEEPAPRRR